MTFRITDQARVELLINENELLTEIDDLVYLNIIESAGTELPVMDLSFSTSDSRILQQINEGNDLHVSMGSDEETMASAAFVMQNPAIQHEGSHRWLVKSNCIKSSIKGWSRPRINISSPSSGIARIVDLARNEVADYDAVGSNTNDSQDSQRWIQYGCPMKQHVDEVWMHSYLGDNSFPLLGYTINGLRTVDSLELFGSEPKWEFTSLIPDGTNLRDDQILYTGHFGVTQMNGFLNSVGGRGQTQNVYVLDRGVNESYESEPDIRMAETGSANVSVDFTKTTNRRQALSRNTHPKYWEAYNYNRTQLALYSSVRMTVMWMGFYRDVRPLDLVILKDVDIRQEVDESVLAYTGRYIVSKVANRVADRRFTSTAELVRESFNANIGETL